MSTEDNKAVIRRFYEIMGDLDHQASMVTDDRIDHGAPPGIQEGPEGLRRFLGPFYAAFPDIKVTIEQILAEGDLVATRTTARGTHTGELMGIAPSGKSVTTTGTVIDRIVDGKIAESWGTFDLFGLLEQIGAIKSPLAAATV